MPDYEHRCDTCKHEWEETYSIKADPPKSCPECKAETVTRLISLGGRGVVELTGQDLVDKIKADGQALKREMHKSENIYANMLGHDKYENLQKQIDKNKRERGKY